MGVGDVVDELGGQQRLQQAHQRHGERVRGDDLQCVEGQGHVRHEQRRQGVRQVALVTDVGDGERGQDGEPGQGHDGDQRRGDDLGDPGEAEHDGETNRDHRVDQERHVDHVGHLGEKDQNGQGIDEAHHHRARDEPHQLGHPTQAQGDLKDTAEHDGGDQVVVAVLAHDRGDHQGDGTGRGRDHRGPATEERDGHGHRERREKSDAGVDPGDDRERDRLRDQRECDDETCQDFGAQHLRGSQGVPDRGLKALRSTGGRSQVGAPIGGALHGNPLSGDAWVAAAARMDGAHSACACRRIAGGSRCVPTLPLRKGRVKSSE